MLNSIACFKKISVFAFLLNIIIFNVSYAGPQLNENQQVTARNASSDQEEKLNLELDDDDLAFLAEHMDELEELNDVELSIQDKIELGLILLSIKKDQYLQEFKEHVAYYKERYLAALTLTSMLLGGFAGYCLCKLKLKKQKNHGE